MKIKKTLYNWLTNRFLLIIRNEENFAEKRTFSFNYAKLIVFLITFFTLSFALCFYLVHTALFAFMNPQYNELETNKKLIEVSAKADSMVQENKRVELYNANIRRILMGMDPDATKNAVSVNSKVEKKEVNLESLSPVDENLRKEIEEEEASLVALKSRTVKLQENYFLKPLEGAVTQKFNPKSGKYGVEIATKSGEFVKSIGDGVVIFSNASEEGYVVGIHHKNCFISIYKQNSRVLKSIGDFVSGGESIALPGKRRDSAAGFLELYLWKDGNPLNPENYISF